MNDIINFLGDFAPALTIIGAIIGVLGAGISSITLKRRISAEQRLVGEILREYASGQQNHLLTKFGKIAINEESLPDNIFHEYVVHIRKATRVLEDGQRELVERALDQPSESGRRAYVSKLIRETSTQVPVA